MTIEFEITKEDIVQFNIFINFRNRYLKRQASYWRYGLSVFFLMVALIGGIKEFLDSKTEYPTMLAIEFALLWFSIYLIIAIAWFLIWPTIFNKHVKKSVNRYFDNLDDDTSIGKHLMLFDEDTIQDSVDAGTETTNWSAVKEITEINDHIYISLSEIRAYIVPKRTFDSREQLNNFLTTLKNNHLQNKHPG